MNSIKVVAVDMDGTFLRSDDTYDRHRFRALRRLWNEKGVRFVVASGNPYPQLRGFFDAPEEFGFVADNGALVVDAGDPVFAAAMDPEVVMRVSGVLDDAGQPYLGCTATTAYAPRWASEAFIAGMSRYYPRIERVPSLAEVATQVFKFGLYDEAGIPADLPVRLGQSVGDSVAPVASGHGSMDLGVPGVTKATGLRILLDRWGLREQDVAAFGDSPNDLEMLAAAGRSVAMANADPAVKATARLETESNDDDGVLNQLERWFTEA